MHQLEAIDAGAAALHEVNDRYVSNHRRNLCQSSCAA